MNPHSSDPAALPQMKSLPGTPDTVYNGSTPDDRSQEGFADEICYDPVPPKNTVTVVVRYRIRRRGQPLPYPLDEGDGE